jgi:hypothetical protein
MMFTNINRLYQELASIGRKFNAYNLSAAGNTLLFAVTSSKNENNELLIYESTAKFCLAITKYMSVENHKNCEIHTDVQIDYLCSQHDVVCYRTCLSDSHRSCESVLPLDFASKDVQE